jgi:peptidoglycan/LPS O-acetylase OafA/YrhL
MTATAGGAKVDGSDLISGVAERRDSASAVRDHAFTRVPALDGIRAVAIVAVLLYHHYQFDVPGSRAWAGGFLGVDIFFVLSGFLITTLLLHEHASAGRINFARFWSRRARRLLPAMFALIIGTALLGRYAFSGATAAGVRGEGFATLLYVENWNRLGAAPSALSHTWSLSVEEQWYLVWPLLLAALLVWSRRRSRSLAWPVALLIVASAAECAVLFRGIGERSYYGTDTRAQSLLVGALLAVVLIRRPRGRSRVIEAAGWVAVGFLALMIWRLHSVDPWLYHGGFLLVAAATALLVTAVQQSGPGPLGRLFGSRPLVAVGLISYGLYLYHYPIYLWLTASRTHLTALPLLIARLVVTGLVAVASYFLIERPFRRGQFSGKRALALVGCGGLALGAVALPAPPAPPWAVAGAARYVEAAANIPGGASRVLVAGDATAVSLTLERWFFRGHSIGGAASGIYGCDVVAGPAIVFGKRIPMLPHCLQLDRYFRQVALAFQPKFSVLVVGPGNALDRVVGAKTFHTQSPALRTLIVERLDQMRSALTATRARFSLLLTRCDPIGIVSDAQFAWLHNVLRDWIRDHPGDTLLDDDRLGRCVRNGAEANAMWQDIAASLPIAKKTTQG